MSHTSYQAKHKRYYEAHREDIARKESEKKRWLDYYERNKEEIKRKRDLKRRGHQIVTNLVPGNSGIHPLGVAMMWVPPVSVEV